MLFKKNHFFTLIVQTIISLVYCLVPSYRINCVSLRAVLLPYCKLELVLFVADHSGEAFKDGATIS